MPDNNQFNNLKDMIAFIEDRNLQHDFFKLFAKDIKIGWDRLSDYPDERAAQIYQQLESQQDEHPDQFDAVFTELRTIAFVNAESKNWATLHSVIESHGNLFEYYKNYLSADFDPQSANLAVFITLLANGAIPDASAAVVKEAKETWKEIIAKASSEIRQAGISPATAFEPSVLSVKDREANIKEFEDALRLHMLGKFERKDFYVACHTIKTKEYTHYVVITSPLPHTVVAVNPTNDGTFTKKDDQAKSFEIIVDEYHNRVHSTKTVLIGHVALADCFISHVLKSKRVKTQRLNYSDALQVFKNKKIVEKLTLPSEVGDAGGKVWIESLDVRLKDEFLPTTFRGTEFQDVYTEIGQEIDLKRFPMDDWHIVGAKLKVQLPGTRNDAKDLVFDKFAKGEKEYTVNMGENTFSIPGQNKTFNRKHLAVLQSLKDNWKIKGRNRSQKTLGIGEPSVQGELEL